MPSCAAPSRRTQPGAAPVPALRLAPSPKPEQQPFDFLGQLPARVGPRRERARQPHLRARTSPTGAQLVLPFTRAKPGSLLTPELAEALESALGEAKRHREGSPRQRAAEAQLLSLLEPFLRAEVRRAQGCHEETHLSREDLLQEALLRAQKLWRGFTAGWAGPGRTLYPAYVQRAVSQHLGNVLADARLVGPTQWGRKLEARARRRVKIEDTSYGEALTKEGADSATALALSLGATCVPEEAAAQLVAESGPGEAQLGHAAAQLLARLPRRQRLAVGVPLGLEGPRRKDSLLARELSCTLDELLEAREEGLAALRESLEAAC